MDAKLAGKLSQRAIILQSLQRGFVLNSGLWFSVSTSLIFVSSKISKHQIVA